MFDLQEFLSRGFESGDLRHSITEVDEAERMLSTQPATEFHSQGSGMSSQGLSQGLSQMSHQSDGKSGVELNMSTNSNTNNNNGCAYDSSTGSGGALCDGGHNDSILSVDDILEEFDVGVASFPVTTATPTRRGDEGRLALYPCDDSAATPVAVTSHHPPPPLSIPPSLTGRHQTSGEAGGMKNLSVQPQRQHSRSFNSGLNRLTLPTDLRHSSQTLPKSVSTDVLCNTDATAASALSKKKGKGKDRTLRGVGFKKKRRAGSSEALSGGSSQKPPTGKTKKNKLLLEPRGPLYGGEGDAELRRHSALVNSSSSHLSLLTSVHDDHHMESPVVGTAAEDERGGEGGGEGEGEKRVELQPSDSREETVSLTELLQPQFSPEDKSSWQEHEYGQI